MTKRPAGVLTPSQTRKRRRNGLSSSRAMLDSVQAPPDPTQGMTIWNYNVEKPGVARKSAIPLQPDASTVQREEPAMGEVIDKPTASSTRGRKPGWKQENGGTPLRREPESVLKTVYKTEGEERVGTCARVCQVSFLLFIPLIYYSLSSLRNTSSLQRTIGTVLRNIDRKSTGRGIMWVGGPSPHADGEPIGYL